MKPMSPENLEMDHEGAEVARLYRVGSQAQPPKRLDDAILAAARHAIHRPSRPWQVPLSAAAMLVIGVSLVFLVRDNEPLFPPLEKPDTVAELVRPAPPALKAESAPRMGGMDAPVPQRPLAKSQQSSAPDVPHDRRGNTATKKSARVELEQDVASAGVRQSEPSAVHSSKAPVGAMEEKMSRESVADFAAAPPKEMPASVSSAMPQAGSISGAPATTGAIEIEKKSNENAVQRVDVLADADRSQELDSASVRLARTEAERRKRALSVPELGASQASAGKSVAAPTIQATVASDSREREVADIEQLLREGKTSLARTRVVEFARRHPDYVLPPRLKALLPAQAPAQ
jgi:hypothetical protein